MGGGCGRSVLRERDIQPLQVTNGCIPSMYLRYANPPSLDDVCEKATPGPSGTQANILSTTGDIIVSADALLGF